MVYTNVLATKQIDTPLGKMVAIADEKQLLLLDFEDRPGLESKVQQIQRITLFAISTGATPPIESIVSEVEDYFNGALKEFKTPLAFLGTPFQQAVWQELQKIPYGQTRSYACLATAIGRRGAHRAAAKANSTNYLSIIIPCHRVINSSGKLGGYAGGLDRKAWLISHERNKVI